MSEIKLGETVWIKGRVKEVIRKLTKKYSPNEEEVEEVHYRVEVSDVPMFNLVEVLDNGDNIKGDK